MLAAVRLLQVITHFRDTSRLNGDLTRSRKAEPILAAKHRIQREKYAVPKRCIQSYLAYTAKGPIISDKI